MIILQDIGWAVQHKVLQRLGTMWKQDDLQPFGVFSLNPKWVYYAGKPIENVVYCLNKIFLSSSKEFLKKICFFFHIVIKVCFLF